LLRQTVTAASTRGDSPAFGGQSGRSAGYRSTAEREGAAAATWESGA
jgi:hypothetical protein